MSLKKRQPSRIASLLLLLALNFGALPHAQAQAVQRDRRVNAPPPSATPTPAVNSPLRTPTPAVTTAPARTPTQFPPATQTPTPVATPIPTPTPAAVAAPQTLEELRARIQEVLRQPQLAASHLAVKIVSLDTGRTIFEENANKWLQPASNLKLYTIAAALDRLTPDYRFTTSVYAQTRPDATGTLRGDLTVYGRGDPTFATRFNGDASNNYYKAIDELAARIVSAGVRRVEGDLVGDESYFTGFPLAPGWEWDDLQWYYGAEVSALTVNDNSVDLFVRPGARVGDPCTITVGPATTFVTVVDRTTTSPRGTRGDLKIFRPLNENVIEVRGSLPLDDRGFSGSVAITRPAMMFMTMLRTSLERQGVFVTGRTRTVDARAREAQPLAVTSLLEIASRQSPPLSIVAAQTMKPSQNLYTELLLRALGRASDPALPSDEAGIKAIKTFLGGAGIDAERVLITDGSGLSRSDLVTAETTLQLLTYMSRHRYAGVYRETLPVAGIDGTLRNRMKGTLAAGNARAKTGTLSSATSLSGYVTSAAGERLVFALMINNPPRDISAPRAFTDPITVLLASFTGRS